MRLNTAKALIQAICIKRGGPFTICRHAHINVLSNDEVEKSRTSKLHKDQHLYGDGKHLGPKQAEDKKALDGLREKFPEFLPDPNPEYRDKMSEKLERRDMYRRRAKLDIPDFYIGSVLAVTVSDKFTEGKMNRFVGICIERNEHGLRHNFTLRNIINGQGVEITYDMYCPLIQKVEMIVREKRLDSHLRYLRDCPPQYSYFPQNLQGPNFLAYGPPEVNRMQVPLNPRPWKERWERANLQGIQEIKYKNEKVKEKLDRLKKKPENAKLWEKDDIVKHYRETINPVEAERVLKEVMKKKYGKWK